MLLLLFLGSAKWGLAQAINKWGLKVIAQKTVYDSLPLPSAQRLVALDTVLAHYETQVVYSTRKNFTGKVLYKGKHRFFMVGEAAIALKKVQDSLLQHKINLLLYDAYRPFSTTVKMWEIVPDDRYAANPAKGSMHNRGLAVDLGLADAKTGQPLPMPTVFDDFTQRAWIDYKELPADELRHRELLQGVMKHFGFRPITTEWWHFYWPDYFGAPLLDIPFGGL